jgi:AcrR family transcriptional regulator
MRKNRLIVHPRGARPARRAAHDQRTRQELLEAAGRVFAEKGFERATGKEICRLAGANAAAINYHFGGMVGLYAAVVEEAHGRLVTVAMLTEAVAGKTNARAKLEALLGLIVGALTGPGAASWAIRIVGRELTAPSPMLAEFREKNTRERVRIFRSIVSELTGLPEDHPTVARGCVNVMAPCFLLLTADRRMIERRFPEIGLGPEGADELVQHMVDYALAGLGAVAKRARAGRA